MFSFDDYMKRYRDMPFAPWADAAAEGQAVRDAFAVLIDALERCGEQDMRTDDVMAALAFLEGRTGKSWHARRFRAALDCEQPELRWQKARTALQGLAVQFGG